jgi:hypothetical protein
MQFCCFKYKQKVQRTELFAGKSITLRIKVQRTVIIEL